MELFFVQPLDEELFFLCNKIRIALQNQILILFSPSRHIRRLFIVIVVGKVVPPSSPDLFCLAGHDSFR